MTNRISAPTMHMRAVSGMVDLPTLAKMYEVLITSHDDDDKFLAVWIKENYLPRDFDGVIEQGGVEIKGTEGFAKLYNAYKRVRTLTNRTQDKWPFFDRRWKSMTSAQVTKMATSDDTAPQSNAPVGIPLESPAKHEVTKDAPAMSAVQPRTRTPSTDSHQAAFGQDPATVTTEPEVTDKPRRLAKRVDLSPTLISPTVESARTQPHPTESDKEASELSAAITSTSVLAAKSTAEHSNLDDPPTQSGRRRKRDESNFDERGLFARGHGNLRNKRGRRGGKGGRGRGNKSLATEQMDSADRLTDHTPSTFEDVTPRNDKDTEMADTPVKKPKAPSPRVTRRQIRLSGASDTQGTDTQAASVQAGLQEASSLKSHADSDVTAEDNDHSTTVFQAEKYAAITDNEDTLITDNDSATTGLTDTDLLALSLSHYERPETKPSNPIGKAEQNMNKFDSKTDLPDETVGHNGKSQKLGTVTYFARIQTSTASFEIPLDDTMNDTEKLNSDLLGYAAWREKMGEKSANVSFDTWLSIFSFGR